MDDESKNKLLKLLTNSTIASLGTSNGNMPYVSMVTFSVSIDNSEFYILISGLAKHTKNILNNNNISLMICESETNNNSPQSLARVSITGRASIVELNDKNYSNVKSNYLEKNPSAEMYFGLGDFNLFKIDAEKARYVAGFAKTFNLTKVSLQNL